MNDNAATPGPSDDSIDALHEIKRAQFEAQTFLQKNGMDICLVVTAVASVGILLAMRKNNRLAVRALKQSSTFLKNTEKEAHALRHIITELKEAGLEFTYYPGLGVFEDHKLKIAQSAANHTNEIAKAREALEVLKSLRGA